MSFQRTIKSAKLTPMQYDEHGNPLCRWCKQVVKPPKLTFCSKNCVHEWKLRSSTTYLRKCIVRRDKGICADCGVNCLPITRGFKRPMRGETRAEWKRRVATLRKRYGIPKHRTTFYDVDHILPVAEGGGAMISDLMSNCRLLCIPCHRKVTSAFATKRAKKKAAK